MMTRADKWVAVTVALLAVCSYVLFTTALSSNAAESVLICVNGREYAEYRLRDIQQPKQIVINTEYGRNVLEIDKDGAKMLEADCPDKTDVKCGKITKPNQMLICAPNRLTVRITGKAANNADKVTY